MHKYKILVTTDSSMRQAIRDSITEQPCLACLLQRCWDDLQTCFLLSVERESNINLHLIPSLLSNRRLFGTGRTIKQALQGVSYYLRQYNPAHHGVSRCSVCHNPIDNVGDDCTTTFHTNPNVIRANIGYLQWRAFPIDYTVDDLRHIPEYTFPGMKKTPI